MSWQIELQRINQIRDAQVKSIMAAYFFMNTYNRALMILGEGTSKQKEQELHTESEGLAERWKRMLKVRLGTGFKDLAKIVTQNGVKWSCVNFGVMVVMNRMRYGFTLAIDNDTKGIAGNIAQILCGAKRIKDYVESFGIDFDARIKMALIRRQIRAKR